MAQQVSEERFKAFIEASSKYFSWDIILQEAKIDKIQDKGEQYVITCPFHEDWNPSMRLTKRNGVYHCFSCGRKGTYTKFLWELNGKSVPYTAFCEQVLKSRPEMQSALGFTSLMTTEKTLDPEFQNRRVFDRRYISSQEMPITVLAKKVKALGDSWDNLVLSLCLLQQGLSTDSVLALVKKSTITIQKPEEKINVMDLL